MSDYIKVGNHYKIINKIYRKENGTWVEKQIVDMSTFLTSISNVIIYNPRSIDTAVYMLLGPDSIAAETFSLDFLFNNKIVEHTDVTWSITTGSEYASIDSSGNVTINSIADDNNITVHGIYEYGGETYVADKEVNVTYVNGATSTQETTVVTEGDTTTVTTTVTIEYPDNSTQVDTIETVTEGDGSHTDITGTVITNADGSSTSSSESISYDAFGDVTGSTTVNGTVNADGSSSTDTMNYDANGDPVSAVMNDTDVDGNAHIEELAFDSSGNSRTVDYTIDTSNNPDGYEDITGTGVNTHFIPFHGSDGFRVHIRFRSTWGEQPNPPIVPDPEDPSLLYNIIGAKSPFSPWPGFYIRWASSKLMLNVRFSDNSYNNTVTNYNTNNIYDFTITYNPAISKTFSCINNATGAEILNSGKGYTNKFFRDLDDLMVTVGYATSMEGEPYRYSNVDIYEFNITKI